MGPWEYSFSTVAAVESYGNKNRTGIRTVREDRPSLTREQLILGAANRFGFRRITGKLKDILDGLLDD